LTPSEESQESRWAGYFNGQVPSGNELATLVREYPMTLGQIDLTAHNTTVRHVARGGDGRYSVEFLKASIREDCARGKEPTPPPLFRSQA
jgi:hypothetical protein